MSAFWTTGEPACCESVSDPACSRSGLGALLADLLFGTVGGQFFYLGYVGAGMTFLLLMTCVPVLAGAARWGAMGCDQGEKTAVAVVDTLGRCCTCMAIVNVVVTLVTLFQLAEYRLRDADGHPLVCI